MTSESSRFFGHPRLTSATLFPPDPAGSATKPPLCSVDGWSIDKLYPLSGHLTSASRIRQRATCSRYKGPGETFAVSQADTVLLVIVQLKIGPGYREPNADLQSGCAMLCSQAFFAAYADFIPDFPAFCAALHTRPVCCLRVN